MKKVLYRLDVDYYSMEYDYKACEVSSPIYNKKQGIKEYMEAIKEYCIDNKNIPARAHLWKYRWTTDGKCHPLTIMKNY